MKWADSIITREPIKDVRLLRQSPAQDWQQHIGEREQAAHERGRLEGEQMLGQQLLQQRSDVAELQRGVLDSLRKTIPQLIQESEQALITLALEAAQKVVAGMPISVELVEGVVRDALRQVEDTAEITVQLHPEDLALMRRQGATLLNGLPDCGPLRFISSAEVTRGGCVLQTRFGLIDARRETKIEQLRQAVAP